MAQHDIVVIGTSAGGVEALRQIVPSLPADLPATVFLVYHRSPTGGDFLPGLLTRWGPLPAVTPSDGDKFQPGRIYVAPADHHMVLGDGRIRLLRGPKENGFRPAIDPLFCSAAEAFGSRVVGVILTGLQDDGTRGMISVKLRGGITVVQDPHDAIYPEMPKNVVKYLTVDYRVNLADIGPTVTNLVGDRRGSM